MTDVEITDEMRGTFASDGVVKIPGLVNADQLAGVIALAAQQLDHPGPWATDTNRGSDTNRLFTTRYLWRTEPTMRSFALDSGVSRLAAELMGSATARLYFDHTLVKEPHTAAPTPWHQDIPYWPFLGKQICSVWVACTAATVAQSSLEFVRGSHRWDAYYAPRAFAGPDDWISEFEGEECPDIESDRDNYDIVGFDVEPGDALVFSAWIVHGSPANAGPVRRTAVSTRWLGDDAVWAPHPGSDPTVTQADTTVQPGCHPADDDRFPVGFAR